MPATKGQTGSTLKITLDPYLLQVGFTDQIVSTGGAIGVQAIVMNVADEAKIQLTFLDGQGSSVGELDPRKDECVHGSPRYTNAGGGIHPPPRRSWPEGWPGHGAFSRGGKQEGIDRVGTRNPLKIRR